MTTNDAVLRTARPEQDNGRIQPLTEPEVRVDVTTEVRWFVDGDMPDEVHRWFTSTDIDCLAESRCDTYQLDGRPDVGVKRRFRNKLEMKVRFDHTNGLALDGGFVGRIECWKRWSPADGRAVVADADLWLDAKKSIIKARFDADGARVPLTAHSRGMTGSGCDLEIATVEIGQLRYWTLAFAAFGPMDHHVDYITKAWTTQLAEQPWPLSYPLTAEASYGYPEWLVSAAV